MNNLYGFNMALLLAMILYITTALASHSSLSTVAVATVNLTSLFHESASKNVEVMAQAMKVIASMEKAPSCNQMAAANLIEDCTALEQAPDYVQSRPDEYLNYVKDIYAAKLAVCEIQSGNKVAPEHCGILVASTEACKASSWWPFMSEVADNKLCYHKFTDQQFRECMNSLYSVNTDWTSFSNNRQNAVIMCQASRHAIEKESALETSKSLTQVMKNVTSSMQQTAENFESLRQEQSRFAGQVRDSNEHMQEELRAANHQLQQEIRDSNHDLKMNIYAVEKKAVVAVGAINDQYRILMEKSILELITALSQSQSTEIVRVHQDMQKFSTDLMAQSSQLARFFTDDIHKLQSGLQTLHDGLSILSTNIDGVHDTVNRTKDAADESLATVEQIAERIKTFEHQTKKIADGFAFLNALPALLSTLARSVIATTGLVFLFAIILQCNKKYTVLLTGACSFIFLLHTCGALQWLANLLLPIHKGAGIVLVLWLSAYPITRLNFYIGHWVGAAIERIPRPTWLRRYLNEGGAAMLPDIEIPPAMQQIHVGSVNGHGIEKDNSLPPR